MSDRRAGRGGTGPFKRIEGYSSLENKVELIDVGLNCVAPHRREPHHYVALEANADHWNVERGPRLEIFYSFSLFLPAREYINRSAAWL